MLTKRFLGDAARVALVLAAALAAAASAGSKQNQPPPQQSSAPPPQAMDPAMAMGLWKSSFGAVKIEYDPQAPQGGVQGIWVYDRGGTEVIGMFLGTLRGNVLEFSWQEPAANGGNLDGAGYLVFDPYGQRFSGKWWTNTRDRTGEWTGWRPEPAAAQPAQPDPYAQPTDGYQPPPPPPSY
jgi:hypothetical protein